MQAEDFAESSLDPVANDGSPDGARHREAQPRSPRADGFGTRPAKGGEQGAGNAEALVIDKPEFGGSENAGRPRDCPHGLV